MNYKHKITGTQTKLAEDGKYYIHNCSIGIPKQFIEDSKVWQKEDGYEILEHVDEKGNRWQKSGDWESCVAVGIGDGKKHIISIKRLNDNEVFTVGDKVRFSKDYNSFTVEKITLRDNRLELYGDGLFCSVVESNVYKVMPAILTTKDGVGLFKNDTYYSLGTPNDYWRIQKHTVGYMEMGGFSAVGGDLIFAKKENIENYIKENKPKYSLNDIRNVLTKEMEYTHWIMIDVDKIIKDLENGKQMD